MRENVPVFLFLVYLINATIQINGDERLLVHINDGSLEGKLMKSRSGREFAAFLGIPFAAPPTGSLRFMPPESPQKWKGIRNSTEESDFCVQKMEGGKEDCLYLNVFTHELQKKIKSSVMVYIHGGGFYGGSASLGEYGPEYLMDRDIVLITIQYRLGVFGFLSTEDTTVPGNMGLKDQRKALQWVQENVSVFGGDPLKVTIFGNSAGSASVHFHMISSTSRELFSKAISQSGTALSAFSLIGKGTAKSITYRLAHNLKCPTNTSVEILQCLQRMDAALLQKEYSMLQDTGYEISKVLFRPVVEQNSDHAFLTQVPLKISTDKPWLVGVVKNEGLFKINVSTLNTTFSQIQREFQTFIPSILFFNDTCSKPSDISREIYDFYFKDVSTQNETITSLEHVISDSWFFWPTIQAIQHHIGTVFCYLFDYRGQQSISQIGQRPRGFGVSHMDELHYLFSRKKIFSANLNSEDMNISKLLVNLWVNFAEGGNPTPHPISDNPQLEGESNITWEPSVSSDIQFLQIQRDNLSMVKNVFHERINFWKHLPVRDRL